MDFASMFMDCKNVQRNDKEDYKGKSQTNASKRFTIKKTKE